MATYDASNAEVLVFTFKDGLLSRLAHDLKIRVGVFSIEVSDDEQSVKANFDTRSLEVVCARVDGRDDPATLSRADKKKIQGNINDDVLHSGRYPEARFESASVEKTGSGVMVMGTLMLHGRSHTVHVSVGSEGNRLVGEARLHQPDFGIKPFTAALGALKVKPDVAVRAFVPKATAD